MDNLILSDVCMADETAGFKGRTHLAETFWRSYRHYDNYVVAAAANKMSGGIGTLEAHRREIRAIFPRLVVPRSASQVRCLLRLHER